MKNIFDTTINRLLRGITSICIAFVDFRARHKNVKIYFGGEIPTLHLGALEAIKTSTRVKLFEHLSENTQPVATKPRRYCQADTEFISFEVKRLLNNELIEPINSPRRAQPLVARQVNHKKRMVIDYNQTVNKLPCLIRILYHHARHSKKNCFLDLFNVYNFCVKLFNNDRE